MNAEILTTKSREVLSGAITAATTAGHATVEPAHLLAALLTTEGSTAAGLLRAVGADPESVAAATRSALAKLPASTGATVGQPQLSRAVANVLTAAEQIMRSAGDEFLSTEHLLAALARTGTDVSSILTGTVRPRRR